jgi:integrase/recombinase XerC
MTITAPGTRAGAPDPAVTAAAILLLERMGLTAQDLLSVSAARTPAPTFAEYIPVVSALVSKGCRRAYGSYWNRVTEHWGERRIDEPSIGVVIVTMGTRPRELGALLESVSR